MSSKSATARELRLMFRPIVLEHFKSFAACKRHYYPKAEPRNIFGSASNTSVVFFEQLAKDLGYEIVITLKKVSRDTKRTATGVPTTEQDVRLGSGGTR